MVRPLNGCVEGLSQFASCSIQHIWVCEPGSFFLGSAKPTIFVAPSIIARRGRSSPFSFYNTEGVPAYDARANFDRNGIMTISDFGLLAVNYMKMSPVDVPG